MLLPLDEDPSFNIKFKMSVNFTLNHPEDRHLILKPYHNKKLHFRTSDTKNFEQEIQTENSSKIT